MKKYLIVILFVSIARVSTFGQIFTEILGRPTGNSVTMSILFNAPAEVYWEYGTSPGNYTLSTGNFFAAKDLPLEAVFPILVPDLKYHYRTRFRPAGTTGPFLSGPEHTFHTPRPAGQSFTFAIEADPHLDTNSNPDAYTLTLQNILSENPDFLIDLGDTFFSEKQPGVNQAIITERHALYRPYFGIVCHSAPLFLALGNHEGECGWRLNGTPDNVAVMAANTRKLYYPNPIPDDFYSGDTKTEEFVGLRQNYYAWEWGDALIVVLDPYWYTVTKPDWGWTLGKDQYTWFKNTLTSSSAKFKFVFCHNLVGGNGNDARGGAEFAHLFEMGGSNADGTYGFDQNRPGWGKSIHALMVENHVSIFFHGHDHFYGKQEKDGVIYQEVPQPSNKSITNMSAAEYGYVNGLFLPGRGHLLVTVSPDSARVDYVKTYLPTEENATRKNGEIADSYAVKYTPSTIDQGNGIPVAPSLQQNFPNPFQSKTTLRYFNPTAGTVQLNLFDFFGRQVAVLENQYKQSVYYNVSIDSVRLSLAPGIYYCRLTAGNYSQSIKMICLD
jgi:hypothetical protein